MAVYQGARRRAPLPLGLEPSPDAARRVREARRDGPAARAGVGKRGRDGRPRRGRPSSVGIALAAIVIVFGAAFLSLSQSVRVAATGYDIVRLVSEHDRLQAISQDLRSDVDRLKSEYAIRKQALDAGMGQLGAPLIVEAR